MGKLIQRIALAAALTAGPALAGCSARISTISADAAACTPGATAPCACADGAVATQTCLPIGAYGACACPTPVVDAGLDVPAAILDVPVSPVDTGAPVDVSLPVDIRPRVDVPTPVDVPPSPVGCTRSRAADLLFVVDNSNSMASNQANLARNFAVLISQLVSPPVDPATGRPISPALTDLHVGVISTDLGTAGSVVPSCANSDIGDDGLLNPIRRGQAIRSHQPWTTAPTGARPARCTNDPNQYPPFLTFNATTTNPTDFRDDFVCTAYLSIGGCGLEQQLESAYRALVIRNPRAQPGNMDPNAGFVRSDAVLGIVMLTDEDDGSVRDCRYAEAGVACTDAIGVFDIMEARWASSDLNLRFYMYLPGSGQDPTWNLDRYLNPALPGRGFTSLKPGAPQLVVFGAVAGVPLDLPTRAGGGVDWDALLGRSPQGVDGYVGMSAEGPVSMRQRNMDPSCSTRVVPACRREGSAYDPMRPPCDTATQYFALPSRRIAQVVRRFDETYRNGVLGSVCRNDYSEFMGAFARQIASRFCP